MLIGTIGICGIRLLVTAVSGTYRTIDDLNTLYYSYGLSWLITGIIQNSAFVFVYRRKFHGKARRNA